MKLEQTLNTTGASNSVLIHGDFNFSLSGNFVGQIYIERSFNQGATWFRLAQGDGTALFFTSPCSIKGNECELGVAYRVNATLTSGSVSVRFSS